MSSKPETLVERMKHLLSSGDDADVLFLVGQGEEKEHVPAHRAILNSASDVFEAMFRFDTTKNATDNESANGEVNGPVEVTDIDAHVFKVMLNFIYADDLSELDGDNAMAVLYAAKKYNINALAKACVSVPISELGNVFLAYDQSRLLNENDFALRCLDYIDQNAETLFESEEFLEMEQILLCEILERDQLKIDGELTIWNSALRWADAQCRQNGTECSAENRRVVLGLALSKIRFPLISFSDFSDHVVPSGVLTSDELVGVFLSHAHSDGRANSELYPIQFPTQNRTPLVLTEVTAEVVIPPILNYDHVPSLSFNGWGGGRRRRRNRRNKYSVRELGLDLEVSHINDWAAQPVDLAPILIN
ncbi:hypothetical protein niasHT_010207 [Heterodera trifolii]|uniref:BTB domain-containing protein n=1 Tax=Heterodera trifolii TaxID=157864 RepID=A0ABD2MDM7_9BILA